MSRAKVDPDELRRFAVMLNNTASSIRQHRGILNNSLGKLKDTWRDSKYDQYMKIYDETMPQIESFCKDAERFANYLREKEKPLRRYLERRY